MPAAIPAAISSMSALQATTLALTVASTAMSAYSAYQQQSVAAKVARNNAATAEYQARDAERRGEQQSQEIARRASQLQGTQRATMASRGLDLTSGTPADLIEQTDFFASIDQATARTNARKEAWGKRAMGANYRAEASGYSPLMAAGSSLLGGATSVADRWLRYSGQ
jgi:hypothetical protein